MKNFEHYKDVFMRCKGRNLECVFKMPQDDEVENNENSK